MPLVKLLAVLHSNETDFHLELLHKSLELPISDQDLLTHEFTNSPSSHLQIIAAIQVIASFYYFIIAVLK